jgi:hypothetical protein
VVLRNPCNQIAAVEFTVRRFKMSFGAAVGQASATSRPAQVASVSTPMQLSQESHHGYSHVKEMSENFLGRASVGSGNGPKARPFAIQLDRNRVNREGSATYPPVDGGSNGTNEPSPRGFSVDSCHLRSTARVLRRGPGCRSGIEDRSQAASSKGSATVARGPVLRVRDIQDLDLAEGNRPNLALQDPFPPSRLSTITEAN